MNHISLGYKYRFIAILYFCLLLNFICTIADATGRLSLAAFIVSVVVMVLVSRSIQTIPYLLAALMLNSELMNGAYLFISIRRITLIFCGIYLVLNIINSKKSHLLVPIWFYIIWFGYLFINAFVIHTGGSITDILSVLYMMLTSIILQDKANSNVASSEKLIIAVTVGFSFIVIIAYLELLIGRTFFYSTWTEGERYRNGILRVGSTVSDPNNVCFFLVPFVFLSETAAFKKVLPTYYRIMLKWPTIILILLTSSRIGWIALILGLLCYLLAKRKIILICVLLSVFLLINSVMTLLENILNLYEESTSFRLFIIENALELWQQNFLFGVGRNNIISSIGLADDGVINTMNTYVYMLSGVGIIGFIIYILYWIILSRKDFVLWISNSVENKDVLLKLTSIICLLMIAYTLDTFYMMNMWIMPAIIIAINNCAPVQDKKYKRVNVSFLYKINKSMMGVHEK